MALLVLVTSMLLGAGTTTGHVASVKSIVLALPYFARMGWHVLWHGNVKPARPEIPAEVMALYTPRPTDVIISPAAKSGTTWLMQIAHQLRVKGAEPTWDDQMDVSPWLESAVWLGVDESLLTGDHVAHPRVYKSHLPFGKLPKDAKLVVALRDMGDCIVSMHKFWHPMVDTTWVTAHDDATAALLSGRVHTQLRWLVEWWEHRNDTNVKLFFYQDMLKNHRQVVVEMAEFMGIDADDSLIDKVVEQSTKDYMASEEHRFRFDDHSVVNRLREAHRLPPRGLTPLTGKVRQSKRKDGKKGRDLLTQAHRDALDRVWHRVVEKATGFKNMDEMRAAWQAEKAEQAAGAEA